MYDDHYNTNVPCYYLLKEQMLLTDYYSSLVFHNYHLNNNVVGTTDEGTNVGSSTFSSYILLIMYLFYQYNTNYNTNVPCLYLQKEQMLEAQEMFRTSNKVTRPEKALILGFMAGSRDNPCPHLGNIVTIKLSEGQLLAMLL